MSVWIMAFFQELKKKLHTDDPKQLKKELLWLLGRVNRYRGKILMVGILGLVGTLMGLASNVAYSGPDGNFSLDCAMNLHGDTTVTAFNKKSFAKGTNGAIGTVKAHASIMHWEQNLVFSSENEVKIRKVKFYI